MYIPDSDPVNTAIAVMLFINIAAMATTLEELWSDLVEDETSPIAIKAIMNLIVIPTWIFKIAERLIKNRIAEIRSKKQRKPIRY